MAMAQHGATIQACAVIHGTERTGQTCKITPPRLYADNSADARLAVWLFGLYINIQVSCCAAQPRREKLTSADPRCTHAAHGTVLANVHVHKSYLLRIWNLERWGKTRRMRRINTRSRTRLGSARLRERRSTAGRGCGPAVDRRALQPSYSRTGVDFS